MTVINMLSLGESGIAVADEQGSNNVRKSNVYQKLHPLDNSTIYGGSGNADFVMDIYQIIYDKLIESNKKVSLREIYELTNEILISQKNLLKNKCLLANFGIGLEDFITGSSIKSGRPIANKVINRAEQVVQHFDETSQIQIVLGGMEDKKFNIYNVNTFGLGLRNSLPYDSIGSGADESQKILSNYTSNLKRDKRENIDPLEGLTKVIEATNASARLNMDVGGTISITYISNNEIKIPDEDKCRLASEIVEGLTLGFIKKNIAYDMLNRLIYGEFKFEDIEEEFKHKVKDWKRFDRILRGYRL